MLGGATDNLTADLIARALVAAANVYGDDPVRAFTARRGWSRRSVTAAVVGLHRSTGQPLRRIAALVGTRCDNYRQAEHDGGLRFGRAVRAASAAARCAASQPRPREVRPPAVALVTFEDLAEDFCLRPDGIAELKAEVEANAVRDRPPIGRSRLEAVTPASRPAPVSRPTPSPYSPAHPKLPPAPPPVRRIVQARKASRGASIERRADGVEVIRLQPITPDKLRRIRAQVENGLDLNEAADLFSLDADQLEIALRKAGWRP